MNIKIDEMNEKQLNLELTTIKKFNPGWKTGAVERWEDAHTALQSSTLDYKRRIVRKYRKKFFSRSYDQPLTTEELERISRIEERKGYELFYRAGKVLFFKMI